MVAMMVGAALIVPASGLRLACVGASCDGDGTRVAGPVPFCSLPAEERRLISAGFYDGSSPEVLGVTEVAGAISGGRSDLSWPSLGSDDRVPLVFVGAGMRIGGSVPARTPLAGVAPTVARLLDFERPYPMLERTDPIAGVSSTRRPMMIVEVGLRGVGTRDLESAPGRWPTIASLMREGAGTLEASVGSLPLDPTAVLTTIGTGSLPSQHGITGTLIRDWDGRVVTAWTSDAPVSAIATLADDLDQHTDERSIVGLIAGVPTDRGLIEGEWYVDHDRDVRAFAPSAKDVAKIAIRESSRGFGRDSVPDVLGVVLDGRIGEVDRALGRLVAGITTNVDVPTLFVIAGTGSQSGPGRVDPPEVDRAVRASVGDVVEGQVPGGLFVDGERLAAVGASRQDVRDALMTLVDGDERAVMADAFLSYSVSFGKYC
jgi:hypothetical protein